MFKQIRHSNSKILELYDCSNKKDTDKFKNRFASVIDKFENSKVAQRQVIAIEPFYVYAIVSGLHGNEANDNGDYFKWEELLKKKTTGLYTFETWINKPVLENHNEQHVRGMIVDSWPIENEKSIDFLVRVDERINPNLVKGIRNGSVKGTSMGVMVGHSYCNICNNMALDEQGWCVHLNPSKLNIKGKLYTGQDGNKFPEKIGMLCYEDNRDLEGVEDSFITLGEPADPKALAKTVLAISTTDEGNSEMNNDRQAIAAKRAEMLKNPRAGIRESNKVSAARDTSAGGSSGTVDPKALQRAIADLMHKKGLAANGLYATPAESVGYESSSDVVKAIKEGKLGKRDAIEYVEKFKLVSANKIDELSSSEAFNLLVEDSKEERVHKELLTAADQAISDKDAKPEDDQPAPEGSVNPESQSPSSKDIGDQAVDTNKAKPEDGQPTPDGSISPEKQSPSSKDIGDQAADTNKAKPEDGQPAPKTAQADASDLAIDLKEAKPEEKQPDPEDVSQINSTPKVDTSDLAVDLKEAKPEEQPEPVKTAQVDDKDDLSEEDLEKMTPVEKVDNALNELQDALKLLKDVKPDVPKEKPEDEKEESEEKEEDEEKPEDEKGEIADEIKENIEDAPLEELPALPDDAEISEELPPNEFPAILGYKVELIKDKKSPEDSYYIVSLNKAPVFSITARQAWGKNVKSELNTFVSSEYTKALKAELNKSGAKKVFANSFGSLGIVLAQEEKLPEDTFEEPAKEMNIEKDPLQDITNNDTETQNYTDMIAEVLASVLAQTKGSSPEEIVEELKVTFTSSELASEFAGILREKYEQKQKEKAVSDKPDVYSEEAMPAEELPTELPELRGAAKKLQNKVLQVGKLLPEIKAQLKALQSERDSYKSKYNEMLEQSKLKARVSFTKAVAERKASLDLISEDGVKGESLRLAKLSDAKLKEEIKSLENSVKIAQKISKKKDYSNVESNNVREAKVGTVLTNIPTQYEEEASAEVRGKTFSWSKGFPGRNK